MADLGYIYNFIMYTLMFYFYFTNKLELQGGEEYRKVATSID